MKSSNGLMLMLLIALGLMANGSALPVKKMIYYQQPMSYYTAPQRMMYVQYVQPSNMFARSTQAAEALVAGNAVATGTYLKDCDNTETDIAATAGPATITGDQAEHHYYEDHLRESGAHSAQSIAEAYPAGKVPLAGIPIDVDVVPEENEVAVNDEPSEIPHDYNFETNEATESHFANGYEYDEQTTVAQQPQQDEEGLPESSVLTSKPILTTSRPKTSRFPAKVEVEEEDLPLTTDTPKIPLKTGPTRNYLPPHKKNMFISLDSTAKYEDDLSLTTTKANIPLIPQPVAKRTVLPPRKKVFVELDSIANKDKRNEDQALSNEDEEYDEEEEDYLEVAQVPTVPITPTRPSNKRHQVVKKPSKAKQNPQSRPQQPLPNGSFFPIDFGGTSGGAIAIANSFSTGEGGSATSHAIAYGSPDAIRTRTRARPSKLH